MWRSITVTFVGVTLCGWMGCATRPADGGDSGSDAGADAGNRDQVGGGADQEPGCSALDEDACRASPTCEVASCSSCTDGSDVFAGCYDPALGAPPVACAPCAPACTAQPDEQSCLDLPGCEAVICVACDGQKSFAGCFVNEQAKATCPAKPCPAPCAGLDEQGCLASDCRADYCFDCSGADVFQGCSEPGAVPPTCPPLACPVDPCGGLDEIACGASDRCHPVFADMMVCDCNEPGCCVQFSRCATGGAADCRGPAFCATPAPVCSVAGTEPAGHVVSYSGGCFEGCVRPEDCRQAP